MRCEFCGHPLRDDYTCASCELYNAAVAAVGAAALSLAEARAQNFDPRERTWMNQYGSFHGKEQVATASEVACFDDLTTLARKDAPLPEQERQREKPKRRKRG